MSTLSREEVLTLAEKHDGLCVSIYMPTHRAGAEAQQDPIRFRNLLRRVEGQLAEDGSRVLEIKRVLNPAYELLNDHYLWRHEGDGMAVFVTSGFLRYYQTPEPFNEEVIVARHFYLTPLLALLDDDQHFYVLGLSQNGIRLYKGTPHAIAELKLTGLPKTLAASLASFDSPERHLAARSAGPAPVRGRRSAMAFYAEGDEDDTKERIAEFFHRVDKQVRALLRNDSAPVVLAGVDYLLPIYRSVNKHPWLAAESITGNPEHLSPKTLGQQAWDLLKPQFDRRRAEALAQYQHFANSRRASKEIRAILRAANQRRVATLFVNRCVQEWGAFYPEGNVVLLRGVKSRFSDEDLVNLAVIYTLLHGGVIYVLEPTEMPDEAPAAAVFRY
jgi:hypothetical protein